MPFVDDMALRVFLMSLILSGEFFLTCFLYSFLRD